MFTSYDKFFVALIMAAVSFIQAYSGINLGIDNTTAAQIVAALTPVLVWLVPNKPKADK
ncbi:MAG TPA: hypothetical protein VHP34_11485 [Alphaproteobacteria bacterium]|nr:hypothetical protein [Alphaproteobacteria bacterium]